MIEIRVRDNTKQGIEDALKALKKACNKDGVLKEVKDRQYYKKPSDIRKEKQRARQKTLAKLKKITNRYE